MKHNQKEKQEPVRGVYAWNVKFMRVEVCQKCKFWLLSRRCPVLLASIPPRPLWSHGSDSGLVGESLRDPRVHIQSKTEVFWISKKKKNKFNLLFVRPDVSLWNLSTSVWTGKDQSCFYSSLSSDWWTAAFFNCDAWFMNEAPPSLSPSL